MFCVRFYTCTFDTDILRLRGLLCLTFPSSHTTSRNPDSQTAKHFIRLRSLSLYQLCFLQGNVQILFAVTPELLGGFGASLVISILSPPPFTRLFSVLLGDERKNRRLGFTERRSESSYGPTCLSTMLRPSEHKSGADSDTTPYRFIRQTNGAQPIASNNKDHAYRYGDTN